MADYYFVKPLDAMMVRGNRSFGGGGEHGEALMPPWPSLFAGAFRSAILGQDKNALADFVAGRPITDTAKATALGTQDAPGSFRLSWLSLGVISLPAAPQIYDSATAFFPLPSDQVLLKSGLHALQPIENKGRNSAQLPMIPALRTAKAEKPQAGQIAGDAIQAYLDGRPVQSENVALYRRETRLGIALDTSAGTAAEGKLYTTETIYFARGAGFLVGLDGAAETLPDRGILRLGGDGRGAEYRRVRFTPPALDSSIVTRDRRFRLVLHTPGLFQKGWLPDGVRRETEIYRLRGDGFCARLACVAVNRAEVISGWDLANWRPKSAQRVAPAGSVYWFDQFEGDAGKLATWVRGGLWCENADMFRRAEGFNNAGLAAWAQKS